MKMVEGKTEPTPRGAMARRKKLLPGCPERNKVS